MLERLSHVLRFVLLGIALNACGTTAPQKRPEAFNREATDARAAKCSETDLQSCYVAGRTYRHQASFAGSTERALTLLKRGCEAGHAESCVELGELYTENKRVDKNPVLASQYFCAGGQAKSCGTAGESFQTGDGVAQDLETARTFYQRGCELDPDEHQICVNYAQLLYDGVGGPKDYAEAYRFAKRACNADVSKACNLVGLLLQKGKGPSGKREYEAANDSFEKACAEDYAPACFNLGRVYRFGRGISQEPQTALKLNTKACRLGHSEACDETVDLAHNGDVLPEDVPFLLGLLLEACKQEDTRACLEASYYLRFGWGVPTDLKRADQLLSTTISLTTKRCKEGSYRSCGLAARSIAHGQGPPTDFAAGRRFLKEQCESGLPLACLQIALQRRSGKLFSHAPKQSAFEAAKMCGDFALDTGPRTSACMMSAYLEPSASLDDQYKLAELFTEACQKGDPLACLHATKVYAQHLQPSPRREKEAARALAAAAESWCDGDSARSCGNVMAPLFIHFVPSTVPDDTYESVRRGCDGGADPATCLWQAHMLNTGFQTARDPEGAKRIYDQICSGNKSWLCTYSRALDREKYGPEAEKKCRQDDAWACVEAGLDAQFSSLKPERLSRADKLFEKACTLGSDTGCRLENTLRTYADTQGPPESEMLAVSCETNGGQMCWKSGRKLLSVDWKRAIEHLSRACGDGHELACRALQREGEPRPKLKN